ncbi:hypothetical protein CONPUDRAFT_92023 [Coniophora puteana RWD-64-598 SS2]|uniref:PCI domain-containing protein n=1 Tax=Coniophora puteana (strain RWD-64-598) TaxID=741705 RepID=A0A5M3MHM3_CONPW|nr:uncharacterized protein CONPUDRAFT_92023 [Coniophora puteana RWD-64-598 SS2]EIW78728.1 hypothetical protein CONPUDRAFT_92023 [Coniophora puteana RWD-64-598 SS2]
MILTKAHLFESWVYRGIGNLSKAKAMLTSAQTAANSSYCPLHLQAALNLQSSVLHAKDKNYMTAYLYFFETFKSLSVQGKPTTLNALKYMLLCKVMLNLPEDVTSPLSIKLAVKYVQLHEIESMHAITFAHQNRNLSKFEHILREYKDKLSLDPTICSHHAVLYNTLLQQIILQIVELYLVVEFDYLAEQVEKGQQEVEVKCCR